MAKLHLSDCAAELERLADLVKAAQEHAARIWSKLPESVQLRVEALPSAEYHDGMTWRELRKLADALQDEYEAAEAVIAGEA